MASDGAHRAHRIAVVGQGGSGKSTLAQCLLNDMRHSSKERPALRLMFFLQASDATKLMAGIDMSLAPSGVAEWQRRMQRERVCVRLL